MSDNATTDIIAEVAGYLDGLTHQRAHPERPFKRITSALTGRTTIQHEIKPLSDEQRLAAELSVVLAAQTWARDRLRMLIEERKGTCLTCDRQVADCGGCK